MPSWRATGCACWAIGFRLLDEIPAEVEQGNTEALEHDLILVGLVGMIDPARPEVRDAVQTCKEAGIHVKMVTGDHPATAAAIARELGMAEEGDPSVTGLELNRLDDARVGAYAARRPTSLPASRRNTSCASSRRSRAKAISSP